MTKDYCQGIEYKAGKVEAVYGAEGRLTAVYDQYGVTPTRFRAAYWLKDHLGNTRLAFADENHHSNKNHSIFGVAKNNHDEAFGTIDIFLVVNLLYRPGPGIA